MTTLTIGHDKFARFANSLYDTITYTDLRKADLNKPRFLQYMDWFKDEIAGGITHIKVDAEKLHRMLQNKFQITFKLERITHTAQYFKPVHRVHFHTCMKCGCGYKQLRRGICQNCENTAVKVMLRDEVGKWLDKLPWHPDRDCPLAIMDEPNPEDPYQASTAKTYPDWIQKRIQSHLDTLKFCIGKESYHHVGYTYEKRLELTRQALVNRGFLDPA